MKKQGSAMKETMARVLSWALCKHVALIGDLNLILLYKCQEMIQLEPGEEKTDYGCLSIQGGGYKIVYIKQSVWQ